MRLLATGARLLRALTALVLLAGLLAGVPWLLTTMTGWPLNWIAWPHPNAPPTLDDLVTAITSPWSDNNLIGLLASLGWILWLLFCRDLVLETLDAATSIAATRRGRPRAPVTGRGPLRWVAAALVGAIAATILLDAARGAVSATTSTSAADDVAARHRAVAVAPAQPVAQPPAGPRPAVHVPATTAAINVRPIALPSHQNTEVPASWAQDAPGGTHRVVAGDNLWDLARHHLGNPHRWREIYTLNRGHIQANGYALTDPDEIHIGWTLALPARDHTPSAAEAVPAVPQSPATTVDPPPTAAPPTEPTGPAPTSAPAPGLPAPANTGPAAPPSASPATPPVTPSAAPSDQRNQREHHGVTLPSRGWVSLGLAATIATVAALLRLHHRRRARLSFPIPVSTSPQPAPIPEHLTVVDAAGSRHLASTDTHDPPATVPSPPAVAAPIGIDEHGHEVSLFDLPGPGIALTGPGADGAARAVLAAVLATGATQTPDTRPVVITTSHLLARLLPEGAPLVGLDPDGTSFDGERLIILADTAAAVTHAEEEMIGRRRLLDSLDAQTIADLNARTDHAEVQPPYVLLIEATTRHTGRIGAVAAHRAALDLHPVIIDSTEALPAVQVAADGAITSNHTTLVRLATLAAGDLTAVLAMLTEAVARPEMGTDIDEPAPRQHPATAPTEPGEAVPAQQRHAPTLARLQVLGLVTATTPTGPVVTGMRSGSYAALALLAAHPSGRTLDQLADSLHPDTDPAVAIKRVRTDINTARRVLRVATGHDEAMFVIYDSAASRYRLDPEVVAVDLWQMLTAIEKANNAAEDTEALTALREAAQLYAGDFADGQHRSWATDYATTYRHQILAVYARIAEILEADHPDQAVAALERASELDPVNEELYQRIMRIHGRLHRPDQVRRTLRRLEEHLASLGDAEPSEATQRLAHRQLQVTASAGPRR